MTALCCNVCPDPRAVLCYPGPALIHIAVCKLYEYQKFEYQDFICMCRKHDPNKLTSKGDGININMGHIATLFLFNYVFCTDLRRCWLTLQSLADSLCIMKWLRPLRRRATRNTDYGVRITIRLL